MWKSIILTAFEREEALVNFYPGSPLGIDSGQGHEVPLTTIVLSGGGHPPFLGFMDEK